MVIRGRWPRAAMLRVDRVGRILSDAAIAGKREQLAGPCRHHGIVCLAILAALAAVQLDAQPVRYAGSDGRAARTGSPTAWCSLMTNARDSLAQPHNNLMLAVLEEPSRALSIMRLGLAPWIVEQLSDKPS